MAEETEIQSGQMKPAQLGLEAGAFYSELLPIIGSNKLGWSGEDHLRFVEKLMSHLIDEEGSAWEPTPEQLNRLRLIFRPTEALQRTVFNETLLESGYKLDEATEQTFVLLLSAAQFAQFLAKENNPTTGQPFIGKDKKRGAKKNTFVSLIAPPPASIPKPEQEEEASPEDKVEVQKPRSVVAPARKASVPTARKP